MNQVSTPHHVSPDIRLGWLPTDPEWKQRVRALNDVADPLDAWARMVQLANVRLDFIATGQLDHMLRRRFGAGPPAGLATKPIKLAVLGSSTTGHLLPAIRVGALRRGLWVTTHEGEYGQYANESRDPSAELRSFRPDAVLFALDSAHMLRAIDAGASEGGVAAELDRVLHHLRAQWRSVRGMFDCLVIQQTFLPIFFPVMGSNDHLLPGSKLRALGRLNQEVRALSSAEGVDLLAVDDWVARFGLPAWHDPMLWHRAKQEISPLASPFYGDLLGRLLAARQGRSAKCLVLDLDNTLWGGVIGDDGVEGIVLGQGSAAGEAFLVLQAYALDQAKRGVLLAVCSKNDEANALAAFDTHPDMLLRRKDIACFVANWDDKASNIRTIAARLNIGVDSLVFVDDNPFERNLVRAALPMVAVPELPEEPGLMARTLADAGYFEGVALTDEDRERTKQYKANADREALLDDASDLDTYLRGLDMRLIARSFDSVGVTRVTQLINKTNQFNLTTRRYSEGDVRKVMESADAFGVYMRLTDRFGDNGIIAIVVCRLHDDGDAAIDIWLMSCRVLKRQVEEATLNILAEHARSRGARRLIGEYIPTSKNGMVKDLYPSLGFSQLPSSGDGSTRWALDLSTFRPRDLIMTVVAE